MIIIYNSTPKVLKLTLSNEISDLVIYKRMKLHGIRTTYCQWIIPGTIEC